MTSQPPTTRLNTSADALIVQLKVAPALVGLTASTVTLESQDKSIILKLPPQALPNTRLEAGDLVVVGVFITKTLVEATSPFEAGLLKGLDS